MVHPTAHLGALRERTQGRAVDASSANATATWAVVGTAQVVAWIATYLGDGSKSSWPHAFYLSVVVAAVRFGAPGGVLAAAVAGIAVGPFMPLDVSARVAQDPANWLARLAFLVIVGAVTGYLCRHSMPSLRTEVVGRRLRRELEYAVDHHQLQLAYQPIVDLSGGRIVGAEALIRWDHPDRGLVSPAEFIPCAEAAGCIGTITRFVALEACVQAERWRETVLADRDRFKLAVNISGSDLLDPHFPAVVGEILKATGLPASWLHLEITETALVADVDRAADALRRLRRLGVKVAIDDFGTGESSLGYLDQFPVDTLKVDRVFLRRLINDDCDDALTHGIVAMAHAMGLVVVAEGVETELQASAVRMFGYDLAQGFLFSPPVGVGQFEALLASPEPFGS